MKARSFYFKFLVDLLVMMQWITCYYLKKTHDTVHLLKQLKCSNFVVRNDSQLFNARTLALVYGEVSICCCSIYILYDNENNIILASDGASFYKK